LGALWCFGLQTVSIHLPKVLTLPPAAWPSRLADAAQDGMHVTSLLSDEIAALRAIGREPQAYTLNPAIRALVRKGFARIAEGRGVVLTQQGEEKLMALPPEQDVQALLR